MLNLHKKARSIQLALTRDKDLYNINVSDILLIPTDYIHSEQADMNLKW